MHRIFPLTALGLLTLTALVAATSVAADTGPGTVVHQYFNEKDGNLTFTTTAPLVRNPATWTTTGTFRTDQGLHLVIPIANADPNDIVLEDNGTHGWISVHTAVKPVSSGTVRSQASRALSKLRSMPSAAHLNGGLR